MINLQGKIHGVPVPVLIGGGTVILYVAYKKFGSSRKAKGSPTDNVGAPASGTSGTPYGPLPGNGVINNLLPENAQDQTLESGQAASISSQNQAVGTVLLNVQQAQVGQNKILASLLAVNPGALAAYKNLPPDSAYDMNTGPGKHPVPAGIPFPTGVR